MKNIAIFVSGSGTNAENIIKYFQGNPDVNASLVVSNRANAYALERAKSLGVPTLVFPKEEWKSGCNVVQAMTDHNIDLIVLAGFLAIVPESLLEAYPDRIINIHPSLLPKYGGKGMYGEHVHQAVIDNHETESGITIHYVNQHIDQGAHIAQFSCPVLPSDTPDTLASRIHSLEHLHYPQVIAQLLTVSN